MKNNYSTNFYKAYASWKSALAGDEKYKGYKESLYNKTSGASSLLGTVGNKILDLKWLETIETALPFMDEAIRQNRSFIEQKDEIVSIEKVKRINVQSIRHLAQHTNMIARVEDNGDVLPNNILNIFYESNVAIYENRFLYTLLGRLNDFIDKRYNDLKSQDEKISIKYDINKMVRRNNKYSKMSLEFEYKSQADTRRIDTKEDVSNLTGYERVLRIRRIISDFYSLTLIKNLHGVELVKSPIIQTNLLQKNVNFRKCVELWDYIARYKFNGYYYENKEFSGKMPKKTDTELSDVFVFTNYLTEMSFNTSLRKQLESDYNEQIKLENQIKKEKLLLEEQKRKEKIQELLRITVEKKTTPLIKKIDALQAQNEKLSSKYELLQNKHEVMLQTVNDVMRKHSLIEQEEENIRNLNHNIELMQEQIRIKNIVIKDARCSLISVGYPISDANVEQETNVSVKVQDASSSLESVENPIGVSSVKQEIKDETIQAVNDKDVSPSFISVENPITEASVEQKMEEETKVSSNKPRKGKVTKKSVKDKDPEALDKKKAKIEKIKQEKAKAKAEKAKAVKAKAKEKAKAAREKTKEIANEKAKAIKKIAREKAREKAKLKAEKAKAKADNTKAEKEIEKEKARVEQEMAKEKAEKLKAETLKDENATKKTVKKVARKKSAKKAAKKQPVFKKIFKKVAKPNKTNVAGEKLDIKAEDKI